MEQAKDAVSATVHVVGPLYTIVQVYNLCRVLHNLFVITG